MYFACFKFIIMDAAFFIYVRLDIFGTLLVAGYNHHRIVYLLYRLCFRTPYIDRLNDLRPVCPDAVGGGGWEYHGMPLLQCPFIRMWTKHVDSTAAKRCPVVFFRCN